MSLSQSTVINQLCTARKTTVGFYRFLNNKQVDLRELIYKNCGVEGAADKDILVLLDGSSIGLYSKLHHRTSWNLKMGVIDDNCTPGFYIHCSLVLNAANQQILGLGDMVVYTRPLNSGSREEKQRARLQRRNFPLEEQESYVWPLSASNTSKRLPEARQVTYVMDQGADKYAAMQRLLECTGGQLIVRSKEDRIATTTRCKGRLSELLAQQAWVGTQCVPIRALNHYSKTNGCRLQRKARSALLQIRFIQVQLDRPGNYAQHKPTINCPMYVIEVLEAPSSVPPGEDPICWRLLTTTAVDQVDQAWKIVASYQARWHIEQLFRMFKKQGLNIEYSELEQPQSIKKQAVMALKIAAQAMQLTLAREGDTFIPIETMFDDTQQQALQKLNKKLSGDSVKVTNPHADNSLAWAAWVIARMGGWKGYQSQRPPGPITMKRGIEKLASFIWAAKIINDS